MDSLVATDWLFSELGSPDLRILECTVVFERRAGELIVESGRANWAAGHIPGSGFVDLLTGISDQSSEYRFMLPTRHEFVSQMEGLGVGEGTRVVLYDRDHNMWAARVWWMLQHFGFGAAAVLDGGWVKWTLEGRETTAGAAPDHGPTTFGSTSGSTVLVDKQAILEALDSTETCLVNALSAEQHNGENNDYGRRGHIPGAVNLPVAGLVDPVTHAYLPHEQLLAKTGVVRDADGERVIVYCGGGISASSDAFVLSRLGHADVSIYDGSMSEWSADPSLPLEY